MWFLGVATGAAERGLFDSLTPTGDEFVIIIWTWLAMAVIIAVGAVAGAGFKGSVPTRLASLFEHIYGWVDDLARGVMGNRGTDYVPFVMTIFLFVLVSNWFGLLPGFGTVKALSAPETGIVFSGGQHRKVATTDQTATREEPVVLADAPTGNLNTTLALALISFLAFNLFGMQAHYGQARMGGHGEHHGDHHGAEEGHHEPKPVRDPLGAAFHGFVTWLGHFVQPTPMLWATMEGTMRYVLVPPMCLLFIVLNISEEVARVISLTLSLFGNIAGEHQVKMGLMIVMAVFGGLAIADLSTSIFGSACNGFLAVVVWAISVFVTLIGALAGFVQAMVFMLLTLSYISHAVVLEH